MAERRRRGRREAKQFSGELTVRVLFKRPMLIGVDHFLSAFRRSPARDGNHPLPGEERGRKINKRSQFMLIGTRIGAHSELANVMPSISE